MTTTKLVYAFAVIVPGGFAILAACLALQIHLRTRNNRTLQTGN